MPCKTNTLRIHVRKQGAVPHCAQEKTRPRREQAASRGYASESTSKQQGRRTSCHRKATSYTLCHEVCCRTSSGHINGTTSACITQLLEFPTFFHRLASGRIRQFKITCKTAFSFSCRGKAWGNSNTTQGILNM